MPEHTPRRIGIFGGSFDPIHNGHLEIAKVVRERLALDLVFFVPAKIAPHKLKDKLASDKDRTQMIRLAVEDDPSLQLESWEMKQGGISYTVNTLEYFTTRFAGRVELFLIIGSDNLVIFHQWKNYQRILQLAHIVTYRREGPNVSEFFQNFPGTEEEREKLMESELVAVDIIPISSTEIRERVSKGISIHGLVPEKVAHYIHTHGLYC